MCSLIERHDTIADCIKLLHSKSVDPPRLSGAYTEDQSETKSDAIDIIQPQLLEKHTATRALYGSSQRTPDPPRGRSLRSWKIHYPLPAQDMETRYRLTRQGCGSDGFPGSRLHS
jgi:hypothetical protein